MNAGSSSLKVAVVAGDRLELRAKVDRPNRNADETRLLLEDGKGREFTRHIKGKSDQISTLRSVLDSIAESFPGRAIKGVGHRVVHGGNRFLGPSLVTPEVMHELEALVPLAPLHQMQNLAEIKAATFLLPGVPQVACFDTTFHAMMPKQEQMLGLPRSYFDKGVKRSGFHGLSYESISGRLPKIDPVAAVGRTVVCHLGSGASLCALSNCKSIATTMGFTPLDGLLMGTRAGAIDPGVILYLLRQEKMTPDQVEDLIARKSGLLGVSGISSNMRDLMSNPAPEAGEAIDLFCYRVVREIGSMTAALQGLDAIVFTGGIGENSPLVREKVCRQLHWLGVVLDQSANKAGASRLNSAESRISILRIPTDEELMIAHHVRSLIV
jgi:acetate kinase